VPRLDALTIRTPEGIRFSLPLATPVTRCLAWAVDLACVSLASSAVGGVLGLLGLLSPDLARALTIAAYFALSLGYGMILEWRWRGQTIGKRLLRLRVVDESGLRLRFSQVAVRNLLRPVDMVPAYYGVGGLAALLGAKAQRLGDLAAGTVVVRHGPALEPDLDQMAEDRYNSFRDYPHLAARLRQMVTPELAAVALRAVLRRERLEPDARVALFGEIAPRMRALVAFPEEAIAGLTDEQYVRNAVDVCFRVRNSAPEPRRQSGAPGKEPLPPLPGAD
jgi:uncharacterized RDD family membrane protein YckC